MFTQKALENVRREIVRFLERLDAYDNGHRYYEDTTTASRRQAVKRAAMDLREALKDLNREKGLYEVKAK